MSKLQRYHLVEDRPTRMQRLVESVRSYWLGTWATNSHDFGPFWGGKVSSGVTVNEASALNYSAVWAAVSLISSQVGNLPLVLYKKDGRSKTRYESHPLYRLVHDRPNPEMSAFTQREMQQAHVLLWGNTFAEIERNGEHRPAALWPITPDRVTPFRRSSDSPIEYRVLQQNGQEQFIQAANMLHVPGLGYDEYGGYSVVAKARESLGLGLATERFGGSFFGNGATFGGVISYPGPKPTELAEKAYREALETKHQGPDRAHKLLALYNGASYTRMGIPPNDAQFLETRTFQIDEVARWFNLPPHKLKELMRSTNNNIEHQNLEYYIDCLAPWLERWEQELNEKLISRLERNTQEIEFVADGLLRGDSAGRGEFHSKQFNTASITPNEIRQIENRNPLPGGDRAFVALNMIPLDRYDEWLDAEIEAKKPKPVAAPPPPAAGPTREALDKAIEERDAARRKAQEEEDLRDIALSELKAAEVKAAGLEQLAHEIKAAATAERDTLVAHAADLSARLTTVIEERDVLTGTLQTAAAVEAELRAQTAVVTGERDHERTDHAKTQDARVLADARSLAAEVSRQAMEADFHEASAATEKFAKQLDETQAAIRAAVVDDLRWLVEHESDRARRAQGSPEKLRTWLGQFYAGHEERIRKVLRPSVRAWVVCVGHPEPVEHLLDLFVAEYLTQSERQLRAVADEHDAETLAFGLEKILRRWDADRAETIANRVLREVA